MKTPFSSHSLRPVWIDWTTAGALEPGLRELLVQFPDRFQESGPAVRLTFLERPEHKGFSYVEKDGAGLIGYAEPCDAFRALARVMALEAGSQEIQEPRSFDALGVMLDVSRNGVLTVSSIKRLLRSFALMGLNTLQLYLEDVYEIEGEPFFGYFRGRYSVGELREIDAYAARLGIEVVPCIQTLGHLEQVLQWPAYADLADVPAVLMVGDPRTEALVGKMLDTISGCFRSRRIHIGMDEAHGMALGRYRRQNGERRPFDVLNEHLQLVAGLCRHRGLQPLIWSDMYFRLGSKTNSYYDVDSQIPDGVTAEIPSGATLVYWDYYHWTADFYTEWIARHRRLGKEPIFAAGAWTWNRFWTHYPLAFASISAGMTASRAAGLREAFVTVWGDDGTECDPFSLLPAVQYFAECARGEAPAEHQLERAFLASCDGNWKMCLLGNGIDAIPALGPVEDSYANFGKWILWHDPLLGFLEAHIAESLPEHYRQLSATLAAYPGGHPDAIHAQFACALATALALKSTLHRDVRPSYQNRDHIRLRQLLEEVLPATLTAVEELQRIHRRIWWEWRKPFGWDVLERRYAGLLSRLRSLDEALRNHLQNPEQPILELDEKPLRLKPGKQDTDFDFSHARASSANASHAI
jgi:hexosaminidase